MEGKLANYSKLDVVIPPQDIGTTDITSPYQDVAGYQKLRAILATAILADTKIATIQFMQAKAADASPKVLGDAITFTAGSGVNFAELVAEANLDQMDSNNGYVRVAVKVGTDVNGTVGCVVLEFAQPGYIPAR